MQDSISAFPKFTPLKLAHREVLKAISDRFPSSDFNFAGLYTWDTNELVEVALLSENLVIKSSDYLSHETIYSFIGDKDIDETLDKLSAYIEKLSKSPQLVLVPQSVVSNIGMREKFEIVEDRDNHDYIYLVNDLVDMPRSRYKSKRNLLNRFQKNYGEELIEKEIDLTDLSKITEIQSVMKRWQASRGKDNSEVADETIAINKALRDHKTLDMRAFGVFLNNTLIAFTLFEILPNKMAIVHFDRADTNFEGVFVHLKHTLAKHLSTLGAETINYEQDLGIEGLRTSKLSYHPVKYIKKYTITKKS